MSRQYVFTISMPGSMTETVMRLFRGGLGALSLAALVGTMVAWVQVSVPFDPQQTPAIPVVVAESVASQPDHPESIPVLTYHTISDTAGSTATLGVRQFAEHLATLSYAGYSTVRLADIERLLSGEPVVLPAKPVLLTFVGGSLSDWTIVDPILSEFGFTAVSFPSTDRIVEPGTPSTYLSTRQMKRMRDSGRWEFGAQLTDLNNKVATGLRESQRFLTETLGQQVTALSYAEDGAAAGKDDLEGDLEEDLAVSLPSLAHDAGFRLAFALAFTGVDGSAGQLDAIDKTSSRWHLMGLGIRSTTSASALVGLIAQAVPLVPPPNLTALRWQSDHGTCVSSAELGITVTAPAESYGTCRLQGMNTSRWRDYTLMTGLMGVTRDATAIIAVRDGAGAGHGGRVEVARGESAMVLRQRDLDGTWTVLANASVDPPDPSAVLAIEVQGDQIVVSEAGAVLIVAAFAPELDRGGVHWSVAADSGCSVTFVNPILKVVDSH